MLYFFLHKQDNKVKHDKVHRLFLSGVTQIHQMLINIDFTKDTNVSKTGTAAGILAKVHLHVNLSMQYVKTKVLMQIIVIPFLQYSNSFMQQKNNLI